jgi:hypothetical protein
MNRILLRLTLCMAVVCLATAAAFAQGRGRGNGNGRRYDVFADRDYRNNRRGNQNWKCGKFVNCHDARDGRLDGRGPRRTTGIWRDGVFYPRGSNVGYRRYYMNDYWRRRHLTYRTQYNRPWRDR